MTLRNTGYTISPQFRIGLARQRHEWEPVELSDQVGYGTAEVDMYDPEVDLGIDTENLFRGEHKGTLTMTEILIYAELNKFITTNEKIHAALAVIMEELDIFSGEAYE